jgi:hypothetical protein
VADCVAVWVVVPASPLWVVERRQRVTGLVHRSDQRMVICPVRCILRAALTLETWVVLSQQHTFFLLSSVPALNGWEQHRSNKL